MITMQNKDSYPKKGDTFYFQAEVIHVKFIKDHILVRLEEYYSKTRFNLKYPQTHLPGFKEDDNIRSD